MNRWLITALAIGAIAFTGCTGGESSASSADGAGGADGAAATAEAATTEDVVYVDVRSPEEFASGHVQGAINIPHTEMADRWSELDGYRSDRIVLYCRSGRRSGIALRALQEAGFTNLENGGGLADLRREGVPVTR